MIKIYMY